MALSMEINPVFDVKKNVVKFAHQNKTWNFPDFFNLKKVHIEKLQQNNKLHPINIHK